MLVSMLGGVIILCGSIIQNAQLFVRLTTKVLLLIIFPMILYYFNFYEYVELQRLHSAWMKWNNPFHWKRNVLDLLRHSSN